MKSQSKSEVASSRTETFSDQKAPEVEAGQYVWEKTLANVFVFNGQSGFPNIETFQRFVLERLFSRFPRELGTF
jgi:hypothetical protein